ncbi:hypothetical protein ACFWNQ_13685 [Streptomyces virginiae]|uniref:hypothetical protein n=1 Tax=Streptomyces virginiae TaxID=1961 RepID=UPI003665847D
MRFHPGGAPLSVPYEVMSRFMDRVEAEVRSSRAWMELRPELVEVVHALRQEHSGIVDDEDFGDVLARVRAAVPEADLAVVLAAAFERRPDGSSVHAAQGWGRASASAGGRQPAARLVVRGDTDRAAAAGGPVEEHARHHAGRPGGGSGAGGTGRLLTRAPAPARVDGQRGR